jgi:hypothetical protein
MKPSAFESAVLERIASGTDDSELKDQLSSVKVLEREHTGVGCYTKISVRAGSDRTSASYKSGGPLNGPDFESPATEAGGLTLLWFDDGFANTLEICTFTGDFPENHDELSPFTLDRSAQQGSDGQA